MKRPVQMLTGRLAALLLALAVPGAAQAKSYSSGGHSYSSHSSSSHSSSFGGSHSSGSGSSHSSSWGSSSPHSSGSGSSGSKSFSSSSGKSYGSGSSWSDANRHGYSSSKSYSAGSGHIFGSGSANASSSSSSHFTFDSAAARARKEEVSKQEFTRFKDSQNPPIQAPRSVSDSSSYQARPPPISYRPRVYVPDPVILSTRRVRLYNVFNPYWSRPVVIYNDPYNSFFWWWLLDRSLDERAWWAYNHRYDMDPVRYQALVASDQQLQARVAQLEAQQAARDPNYTPPGVDRDLMYSDQAVARAYSNRPTTLGTIGFRLLAIPLVLGVTGFFIWLIWFKRWQTAT